MQPHDNRGAGANATKHPRLRAKFYPQKYLAVRLGLAFGPGHAGETKQGSVSSVYLPGVAMFCTADFGAGGGKGLVPVHRVKVSNYRPNYWRPSPAVGHPANVRSLFHLAERHWHRSVQVEQSERDTISVRYEF